MGRAKKKGTSSSGEFSLFDDGDSSDSDSEEDLPRDEAGRAKIKNQYVDLLGIRVQKLAGRILNRERINKTLEGVYFVCNRCQKVCHNLDEGLVEDADNVNNLCVPCSKAPAEPDPPARPARPARSARSSARTSAASRTAAKAAQAKSAAKPAAKTATKTAAKTATKSTKATPAPKKPAASRTAASKAPATKASATKAKAKAKPKATSTRTAAPTRRK